MGTHYFVYAEIKVNDRWYNLNPIMKKYDGTLTVRPIYDCGSSFFDVCNDLENHRIGIGIPDDMTPELRSEFHENLDEDSDDWLSKKTWRQYYEQNVFCVRYASAVGDRIIKDKAHKYEGYVSKRAIADFEANETEEIGSWLSFEEYQVLSDKEKRLFQYYQWDEPFDEYHIYRTIYERLCAMLYWFDFADAFEDKSVCWHSDVGLEDVRLFVERN